MAKKILIVITFLALLVVGYLLYYQQSPAPETQEVVVSEFGILKSSYQINHEKAWFWGLGKNRLVVTSSPENAVVEIGKVRRGETPLILEDLSSGQHQLRISKEGYQDLSIDLNLQDSLITRVSAGLLYNPLENFKELSIESLDGIKRVETKVQSRADWAASAPQITDETLKTTHWRELHLYSVKLPVKSDKPAEVLANLDELARKKQGLPAVPFAYIITQDGTIYEGLGVYDFDYQGLMEGFTSGEVPVLVFNSGEDQLTDEVGGSIKYLQEELENLSRSTARVITVLDGVTLQTQEKRSLSLEFVNTGNRVWRVGEAFLTVDAKEGEAISEFYSPNDWVSTSGLTSFDDKDGDGMVLPGETANFSFVLTAPPYPGEFTERVKLFDETVELKVKVEGAGGRVVKITETPTGFLNVREGPSIGSALKGVVYPGEKYLVLEESAGWLKLRLRDGSEGWVINRYVVEVLSGE